MFSWHFTFEDVDTSHVFEYDVDAPNQQKARQLVNQLLPADGAYRLMESSGPNEIDETNGPA